MPDSKLSFIIHEILGTYTKKLRYYCLRIWWLYKLFIGDITIIGGFLYWALRQAHHLVTTATDVRKSLIFVLKNVQPGIRLEKVKPVNFCTRGATPHLAITALYSKNRVMQLTDVCQQIIEKGSARHLCFQIRCQFFYSVFKGWRYFEQSVYADMRCTEYHIARLEHKVNRKEAVHVVPLRFACRMPEPVNKSVSGLTETRRYHTALWWHCAWNKHVPSPLLIFALFGYFYFYFLTDWAKIKKCKPH